MTTALDYSAITAPVSCSMRADCRRAVSHVDENGFYCATCAAARRAWKSCRKLRPAEIRRLGAVWEMSYLVKVRGEHGCSVMATLESAVGQAEHYRSATAGRVVDIFETRACGHCRGAVPQKACKVCKGVEPADVLLRTLADDAEPVPAARDPRHEPIPGRRFGS